MGIRVRKNRPLHGSRFVVVREHTPEEKAVLAKLSEHIDKNETDLMKLLKQEWETQKESITVDDLIAAATSGKVSAKLTSSVTSSYQNFGQTYFTSMWEKNFQQSSVNLGNYYPSAQYARTFANSYSGRWATIMSDSEATAFEAQLGLYKNNPEYFLNGSFLPGKAEEFARAYHQTIGLSTTQTKANMKRYETLKASFETINPNMSESKRVALALKSQETYAKTQMNTRAHTISITETARMYNQSSYYATKDAIKQGLLGPCEKVVCTAADERVCGKCGPMEGKRSAMSKPFSNDFLLPPFHNRCRCGVLYEETGLTAPTEDDTINIDSMEAQLGVVHPENILTILDRSPETVRNVWNKYADDFVILDYDFQGIAHYHQTDKGIRLDINKVSVDLVGNYGKGVVVARKAYTTLFHELGHHTSALWCYENNYPKEVDISDAFRSSKYTQNVLGVETGFTLTEMLKLEGRSYIEKTATTLSQVDPTATIGLNEVYSRIAEEIWAVPMYLTEAVSDIWDGISNGGVKGTFRHTPHDANYWTNHSIGTEAFAEMFEATVHNQEAVELIQSMFPKSYELFMEILESMVE